MELVDHKTEHLVNSPAEDGKDLIDAVQNEIGDKRQKNAVETSAADKRRKRLYAVAAAVFVAWVVSLPFLGRAITPTHEEIVEHVRLELLFAASELDEYQQAHGHYPASLVDLPLGVDETVGWQYQRTAGDRYVIGYALEGIEIRYDSTTPMERFFAAELAEN